MPSRIRSRSLAAAIFASAQPPPHRLLCSLACLLRPALQTILKGQAKLTGPHTISYGLPGRVDVGGSATARDIIIATGSVPFVPGGIEVRGLSVAAGWLAVGQDGGKAG